MDWIKEKTGRQEPNMGNAQKTPFSYPSAIQQMQEYGFKYLKETDTMAERKERIRQKLDDSMEEYLRAEAENNHLNMKIAINELYNLCQLEIIPYFRTIENEELLQRAKMFMFKYDINQNAPNAYPKLITYIRYLLAHFTKIDVTVPIPFVIQNQMPFMPEGGGGQTFTTSGGRTSEDGQMRKPNGGPYPRRMSNDVRG